MTGVSERANDAHRDITPAERPDSAKPPCASDQASFGVHDNGMQQTQLVDTGGEAPHVANLSAVPFSDSDIFQLHGWWWLRFSYRSKRARRAPSAGRLRL
jgi:hypothetical protein